MSVITDHWRLKLLAVGLAILMLAAVAFAQNPPQTRTLTVSLNYNTGPEYVLIDPPTKVAVTIAGLADVIASVTPDNIVALADASKAKPGRAKLNVRVTTPTGVTAQTPAPIAVQVDDYQSDVLPVQVVARPAPGWSIDKAVATCPTSPASESGTCSVTFTGPATWEVNLAASVVYSSQVNVGVVDLPNATIVLQNSNGTLNPSSLLTVPATGLDVTAASIHIEAHPGSTSSTVPLVDSPPSQPPPSDYRVTGITISPVTVIISGDAGAIGRIQRIMLPPVDLSGHISDFTIQVTVVYPNGVTGSVTTATIKFSISPNPNVSASP
jgi:YbbR domain-containing protein